MDKKNLLTTLMIVVLVMLAFSFFNRGGGGGGGSGAPAGINPMYRLVPAEPTDQENGAAPRTIVLGGASKDEKDLYAVRVDNVTAGIDDVKLNVRDYAATVKRTDPLTLFTAVPQLAKPFSTLGVHITLAGATHELAYGKMPPWPARTPTMTLKDLRDPVATDSANDISESNSTNILDRQYVWQVDQAQTNHTDAVLYMTFKDNGADVVKLFKRFHIVSDSYELQVTYEVQNLTGQPIRVRIDQTAAPDLWRDDPQMDDRSYHAVILDTADKSKILVNPDKAFNAAHGEFPKFSDGTRGIGQFSDFANSPFLWAASSNRFFTAVVRPLPESTGTANVTLMGGRTLPEAHHVASANVDVMSPAQKVEDTRGILRLTGATMDVAPNSTLKEPLAVFLGPKKREILQGSLTAPVGSQEYDHAAYKYISLIQYQQGCYSYCVSDWVVGPILWLLNFLKNSIALGNWGVAIMILVIVVRALLHPLTRASQVNMAKMGKQMRDVQPQMEAMKKKYADNKKKQSEEMMRIYRENKINPAGGIMGCLPMLIQMPIWAALYSGLRMDIDLRHAAFIPGWINDLSTPDTIFPSSVVLLGQPWFRLPVLGWEVYGLNLLPLLLAGVFYFQMKVTTATQPKPADEQQAQMQKMSSYMIFMFPLFLYNAPSGLNLYIFASTMGGLLDTYIVRKALKKQGILAPSASLLPTHEDADGK